VSESLSLRRFGVYVFVLNVLATPQAISFFWLKYLTRMTIIFNSIEKLYQLFFQKADYCLRVLNPQKSP